MKKIIYDQSEDLVFLWSLFRAVCEVRFAIFSLRKQLEYNVLSLKNILVSLELNV